MNRPDKIFRKKTIEKITSPDKLTDYLRVTNPGVWLLLTIIIILLAGLVAWASIGTLETKAAATILVEDHDAIIATIDNQPIEEGMPFRIAENEYTIASVTSNDSGHLIGLAEVNLPDGIYTGNVITERIHPINFLLTGR